MIRVQLRMSSPALEAGLRSLLASAADISILNDANGVGTRTGDTTADVVITTSAALAVDSDSPQKFSQVPVLFIQNQPVSMQSMSHSFRAWGILSVECSAVELSAAVHALAAGLTVGSSGLLSADGATPLVTERLTDRETEVLRLVSAGLANKQIAVELGISEHTVKFHVSSIYTKLGVSSRTQAVREGLRLGLIAL